MDNAPTPDEVDRFWAIRKGVSAFADLNQRQLFLDVTTAISTALFKAKEAGTGPEFEPLWHDPPVD